MKDKKTRKLICNITGKSLFASKDYYEKKVIKAGSEDILHKTYICQDAKMLLKKGYNLQYVQETLPVDDSFNCTLTETEIHEIVGGNDTKLKFRLNNLDTNKTRVIKTDPDVTQFIQNILKDG